MLLTLLTVPRANVLFIAYIRSESKEILWLLLKELNEEFQLGMHFGEAELTVTNGKGAWARLAGCESFGDVDKFRGVARHLVILDEAATWHAQLLEDLIRKVIEPRLGDYKGTLLVGGTPGEILAGLFYQATGQDATTIAPNEQGAPYATSRRYDERNDPKWQDVTFAWSLHGWPLAANTSERGQSAYAEALLLKERNGWSDQNPIWQREYLGRWIADDSKLVFRYDPARNDWKPGPQIAENPFGLPEGHSWRFCICADMGFHDPFSLQVGAYSDTHPDLFQVYECEKTKLTVTGVAEEVHKALALIDEGDVESMVADLQGLGGMVVETLAAEYGLYFEALAQRDKRDHIEITNSGLVDRRIWVLHGSKLSGEMSYLAWDVSGLKPRSNQPNNNCDAFLGVVRHSRHLEAVAPVAKPKPGTAAYVNAAVLEEEQRIADRTARRQRNDNPDADAADFFSGI